MLDVGILNAELYFHVQRISSSWMNDLRLEGVKDLNNESTEVQRFKIVSE